MYGFIYASANMLGDVIKTSIFIELCQLMGTSGTAKICDVTHSKAATKANRGTAVLGVAVLKHASCISAK